jgi:hypothetical protein
MSTTKLPLGVDGCSVAPGGEPTTTCRSCWCCGRVPGGAGGHARRRGCRGPSGRAGSGRSALPVECSHPGIHDLRSVQRHPLAPPWRLSGAVAPIHQGSLIVRAQAWQGEVPATRAGDAQGSAGRRSSPGWPHHPSASAAMLPIAQRWHGAIPEKTSPTSQIPYSCGRPFPDWDAADRKRASG